MQAELQTLSCPYCSSPAVSRLESEVLPRGFPGRWIWICSKYPECDARVGCHSGTATPLGQLADKELREARMAAHKVFDPLWVRKMKKERIPKGLARRLGYEWLSKQLGVASKKCHIAMFNVEQCQRVVAICAPYEQGHLIGKRRGE